jgi:hypothetical protein
VKAKHLAGAALLALAVSLSPVVAGAQELNVNHSGVAISGYDPVAYFTTASAVKGSPEITVTEAGATYRFSTTTNRDAFLANPARYLPCTAATAPTALLTGTRWTWTLKRSGWWTTSCT